MAIWIHIQTETQEGKRQANIGKTNAARNLLVGAIDFGTTNSGWAFSFLHEFQTDPTKASVRQWRSGGNLVTEKVPACVLIKPDGKTLEAFGYAAEVKYRDLTDKGDHEDYYYFGRFKMTLKKELGDVSTLSGH
ncbi:heat shock 70 kDa protein 12B-like [Mercenaria mercenaria]|uniref:heat shock 70 kDa protein 12B-like n=1 Tax=Mercenaria mercenaria TaxID=6596 RepID=UPI00234F8293|nr:heat shock 70 kDa protein 12B-like [Mercenaria mercenaria]